METKAKTLLTFSDIEEIKFTKTQDGVFSKEKNMETKAKEIVVFTDALEGTEKHYGIFFENGFILCFCCGGYFEPGHYIIIEHCDWDKVDKTLLKNY